VIRFALLLAASLGAHPLAAQDTARLRAWREDLDTVLTVFLAKDSSFAPAARAAVDARVRALRDSVDALTDEQLIVRLAAAIASSDNAHTRLYLVRNRTVVRRLPVRVWWFGSELRVVRAKEETRALLGARLTHIAGRPVAEVAQRVRPLYAGNESWARYMSTYTMTSPELLRGLGLLGAGAGDGVPVRAVGRDGRTIVDTLVPMPLERTSDPTEAWWDMGPLHPGRGGAWLSVLAADTASLPLYLRRPTDNYWTEWLPGSRTLYVNYARSQDQPGGETTRAFGERLLREIAARAPQRVVLDVRFNTGGNLDLAEPLFRALAALPLAQERGRLFAITGRATFSAGQYPVALLRERAKGLIVVGEPFGDRLDYWSEGGNILLPHSKLTVHFADRYHSYSDAPTPAGRPIVRDLSLRAFEVDVPVETTFAEWASGRDVAMERVLGWK